MVWYDMMHTFAFAFASLLLCSLQSSLCTFPDPYLLCVVTTIETEMLQLNRLQKAAFVLPPAWPSA